MSDEPFETVELDYEYTYGGECFACHMHIVKAKYIVYVPWPEHGKKVPWECCKDCYDKYNESH